MLQLSIMFYDLTFISLLQTQQQPRPVEAGCVTAPAAMWGGGKLLGSFYADYLDIKIILECKIEPRLSSDQRCGRGMPGCKEQDE